jgi:mono/diheme cytochrome c family protein
MVACGLLAFGGPGCSEDDNPVSSDVVFPPSNVSYGVHVQTLFNQTCTFSGCHADNAPAAGLSLTTYDKLMFNDLQVVVREQPDQSILVLRIEGRLGARMPLNRPALTQNQINGIRTWIAEGALNN